MDWRKLYRTPKVGNKIRPKEIPNHPLGPYKTGKIYTLTENYQKGQSGSFWVTEEVPGFGIEEKEFEVVI